MEHIIEFMCSDYFVTILMWTWIVSLCLWCFTTLFSMWITVGLFFAYVALSVGPITFYWSGFGFTLVVFGILGTLWDWWHMYRYIRGDDGVPGYPK